MTVVLAAAVAACLATTAAAFFAALWWGERGRRIAAERSAGFWSPEPARRLDEPPVTAEEIVQRHSRATGPKHSALVKRAGEIAPHLPREKREAMARRVQGWLNGIE